MASKTVNRNAKLERPADPDKDGFVFAGWFTDKELTEKYDFDKAVTNAFTLYAKWTEGPKVTEPPPVEWGNPFSDVKKSDWFYRDVEYAVENGIFSGMSATEFEPDIPMTRAMLATVIYHLAGEPAVRLNTAFDDVSEGMYYFAAVNWAAQNKLVNGIGGGLYAPDAKITREQAAAILMRYIEYSETEYIVTEEYRFFADEARISDYAKNAVQVLNKLSILNGRGNNVIDPQGNITRVEAAAMLHRLLDGHFP